MPFLDDLTLLMQVAGVATPGTNLVTTSKAALPLLASGQATLRIIVTPGTPPGLIQNVQRGAMLRPGALLIGTADEWDEAYAMAQAAYNACENVSNQIIGSGFYRWIRPSQEVYDLGRDELGQVRCAFNVLADYSR